MAFYLAFFHITPVPVSHNKAGNNERPLKLPVLNGGAMVVRTEKAEKFAGPLDGRERPGKPSPSLHHSGRGILWVGQVSVCTDH